MDRLKPAYTDDQVDDVVTVSQPVDASPSTPPAVTPTPRVTRSGRHVCWPKKLVTDAFTGKLGGE